MDYAALGVALSDYLENSFSATELATITKQAEQRIYSTVQLPALRKNSTGTLTASNKYLTLPTDFLSPFSLAVIDLTPVAGVQSFLLNKDVDFMREAFPNPASTGKPTHYAIFSATSLLLGPTPDAAYGAELHYYFQPESIVTASTTWLGTNFETVLLWACILEGYLFLKGEAELIAEYKDRYMEALALLKQLGDGKDRRDAYRSGQVRIPVQ